MLKPICLKSHVLNLSSQVSLKHTIHAHGDYGTGDYDLLAIMT